jgi:ATP-binding cassette subfamily B protein
MNMLPCEVMRMLFGKHVNRLYWKFGFFYLLGIAALIAVDYYQLRIPEIIGSIIGGIEKNTLTDSILWSHLVSIAVIAVVLVVGRFLWRIFIMGTSWRVGYELRNDMFRHAEKLSQTFYQHNKSGALMALFTNDLDAVRMAFGPGILMFFDVIFLGSMALYKMFVLNWTLTVITIIPLSLVSVMAAFVSRITRIKFRARQKALEDMFDFTQENFYGIAVIKAFVNELREMRAFAKINRDNYDKNMSFVKVSTLMGVGIEMFITFIRILMLAVGGYIAWRTFGLPDGAAGKLDAATLTVFVGYFASVIWPMMAVGRLINMRSQAKASMQRIEALLDQPVDIVDPQDVVADFPIRGRIVFNHLTFRYPGTRTDVLRDIDFTIEAGETVGVIGRTGSGKTTLVDVLLRLYNLKAGEVLVDDVDLMRIPLRTIRSAVGYVPQDNFIFSDTVKNNIAFAVDGATDAAVASMAQIADVHENIIEFPNTYETVVGERGVTLSGGQKQRVSIARALMKDPPILIMDDSFSAVDTKTEEAVLEALRTLREGKTTILIAHRISTIKDADKIVVIDDGRVVAVGSHEELLGSSSLYADMVVRQQLEAAIEGGDGNA